jgi:hypothetical protein
MWVFVCGVFGEESGEFAWKGYFDLYAHRRRQEKVYKQAPRARSAERHTGMGLFDTIISFFNWDAKNRATRMLQLHVFLLSIIVYVQFAVTQTYLNDKHDTEKLVAGITTTDTNITDWSTGAPLKVLQSFFTGVSPLDSAVGSKQLINFIHVSCLPLWRTVEHEQTMFRIFLIVFTSIYALYSLIWIYNSWLKKNTSEVTKVPMLRVVESSIWILTQIVEVFFIVYGFLAFYHLYTNSLTPGLYNDAYKILEDTHSVPAMTTYKIKPEGHCFALDKTLGEDLWGKHTPWIWDKLMMDAILMCVVFVLVFIRYILTALFVYDYGEADEIKFGINNNMAQPASLGYPMYNVVAMR